MTTRDSHGCMVAFHDADALVEAAHRLHGAGIRGLHFHTPFPLPELDTLVPARRRWVPWAALAGGFCGGFGTLALQYYAAVIDYPIRVGGRPYASWPAFIPAALEMTLLFTAGFAVIAMLVANGLPRWYHPVFHADIFSLASQDTFIVVVTANERRCNVALLCDLLNDLDPITCVEVPR